MVQRNNGICPLEQMIITFEMLHFLFFAQRDCWQAFMLYSLSLLIEDILGERDEKYWSREFEKLSFSFIVSELVAAYLQYTL